MSLWQDLLLQGCSRVMIKLQDQEVGMTLARPYSKRLDSRAFSHQGSEIHAIGHSTRTIEGFIAILNAYGVKEVVDIRPVPRSRHNPQFNKDILPESLKVAKIEYLHAPKLGGLRRAFPDSANKTWRNSSFRGYADYMQSHESETALAKVIRLSKSRRIVLMCAEMVASRIVGKLEVAGYISRRGGRGPENVVLLQN